MNIKGQFKNNYKKPSNRNSTYFIFSLMIIFVFLSNHSYLGISEYVYFPLALIVVGIFDLIKQNIVIFRLEHFCVLILMVITVLNIFRYNDNFDIGYFISYMLYFTIFLIVTLKNHSKRNIDILINSYILSSIIISSFIIILQKDFEGWVGTGRKTLQFFNGDYADPNFISSYLVFGAIFCLYKFITSNELFKIKFLFFITYIFIVLAIFLTNSRGALIGLILGSLLVILESNFKKKILLLLLFLSLMVVVLLILPKENMARLFSTSYFDQSNFKRVENWEHGILAISEHPILGLGMQNSTKFIQMNYNYYGAVHNTFIILVLNFGFLGSLSILTLFILILKRAIVDRNYLVIGIIFSLIIMGILVELNLTLQFWFILILSCLISQIEELG